MFNRDTQQYPEHEYSLYQQSIISMTKDITSILSFPSFLNMRAFTHIILSENKKLLLLADTSIYLYIDISKNNISLGKKPVMFVLFSDGERYGYSELIGSSIYRPFDSRIAAVVVRKHVPDCLPSSIIDMFIDILHIWKRDPSQLQNALNNMSNLLPNKKNVYIDKTDE